MNQKLSNAVTETSQIKRNGVVIIFKKRKLKNMSDKDLFQKVACCTERLDEEEKQERCKSCEISLDHDTCYQMLIEELTARLLETIL